MNLIQQVSVSPMRKAHILLELLKNTINKLCFRKNVSHPCANGLFALRSSLFALLDDPKGPKTATRWLQDASKRPPRTRPARQAMDETTLHEEGTAECAKRLLK